MSCKISGLLFLLPGKTHPSSKAEGRDAHQHNLTPKCCSWSITLKYQHSIFARVNDTVKYCQTWILYILIFLSDNLISLLLSSVCKWEASLTRCHLSFLFSETEQSKLLSLCRNHESCHQLNSRWTLASPEYRKQALFSTETQVTEHFLKLTCQPKLPRISSPAPSLSWMLLFHWLHLMFMGWCHPHLSLL